MQLHKIDVRLALKLSGGNHTVYIGVHCRIDTSGVFHPRNRLHPGLGVNVGQPKPVAVQLIAPLGDGVHHDVHAGFSPGTVLKYRHNVPVRLYRAPGPLICG